MRMLLEHKEESGYRFVERIVLFGYDGFDAGKEWTPARTFVIKLKDRRETKVSLRHSCTT